MPQPSRYLEVAADLRRRIQAGEFPDRLPSERALKGQYGIGQYTLRPALLILEGEGLIVRQQGANHQVRRDPERILVPVDLPGPVEITAGVASEEEREDLGLPLGAWVMRVWRVEAPEVPEGEASDGQELSGDQPRLTLWKVVPAATSRLRLGDPESGKDS